MILTRAIALLALTLAAVAPMAGAQLFAGPQVWDFERPAHLSRAPFEVVTDDARIAVRRNPFAPGDKALEIRARRDGGSGFVVVREAWADAGTLAARFWLPKDEGVRAAVHIGADGHDTHLFVQRIPSGLMAYVAADSEAVGKAIPLGLDDASAADLELELVDGEVRARVRALGYSIFLDGFVATDWITVGTIDLSALPDTDADGDLPPLAPDEIRMSLGSDGLPKRATTTIDAVYCATDWILNGIARMAEDIVERQANLVAMADALNAATTEEERLFLLASFDVDLDEIEDWARSLADALLANSLNMPSQAPSGGAPPEDFIPETVERKFAAKNLRSAAKAVVAAKKVAAKGKPKSITRFVKRAYKAIERLTATGYNLHGFRARRVAHLPLPPLVVPPLVPTGGDGGNGNGGGGTSGSLQATLEYAGSTEALSASGDDVYAVHDPVTGRTDVSASQPGVGTIRFSLGYDPATDGTQVFDVYGPPSLPGSLVSFDYFPAPVDGFSVPPYDMSGSSPTSVVVEITKNGNGVLTLSFAGMLYGVNGSQLRIDGFGTVPWTSG